jgi:tryptophan 2,3-dioxygenase
VPHVAQAIASVLREREGSMSATEKIVADEKAQLDFSKSMSYGDYLHLDAILNAQHPLSPDHNEMLFIVQHQTSELWMKLMLHELRAAVACFAGDELQLAFKMLARVSRIMEQLVHAWDVLATMTPPEYTAMRPFLAQSSGFQSYQYRCIEFSLGNKNAAMLKPHEHRSDLLEMVQVAYETPSLYDEALRLLARRGIDVPADRLERDWTQPYQASEGVKQAWLTGLPRSEEVLGPVPARRGTDGPGRRLPALALPPRHHRAARDRLQARHRRHRRRELPAARCWRWSCSPRSGACAPSCENAGCEPRRAATSPLPHSPAYPC